MGLSNGGTGATTLLVLAATSLASSYELFVSHSTPHYKYSLFGQQAAEAFTQLPQLPHVSTPFGDQLTFTNSFFPSAQTSAPLSSATQDTNPNRCGVQAQFCEKSRYRTFDGTCNNLKFPSWGSANSSYARLLPAKYGDGVSTPTDADTDKYPLPRVVSLVLFPDIPIKDPKWTLAAMQYGQIMTHDMAMIAGSTQSKAHRVQCCTSDGQLLDKSMSDYHCYPMIIPQDDPFFAKSNIRCRNFVRTITDRDRNCVAANQQAEQLTQVTAYLDGHIVYGQTADQNAQLREFRGGRLRVETKQGKEYPPSAVNKTAACDVQSEFEACYVAGDNRVNQNPQLTIIQIIMLREHNRIANALAHINPHWNDEAIFQEARRILIAEHQHISYYEWLPIFLGQQNLQEHHVIYPGVNTYVNDYNKHISPAIINSHSTTAFRYFHSAIAGELELVSPHRNSKGALRLSDWFNRPGIIEEDDNFDDLTRGLGTQPELNNDPFFSREITQFLFRSGQQVGNDLRAIDIQRNRDHGLASYNDYREFCGLPKAYNFEGFLDVISKDNVEKLASLYRSPDDVDLTVGGSLEAHVDGTLSGPTFLCIMTEQFYRTRVADRHFYENGNDDTAFTPEQLNSIRRASISRWFCDNGHHVQFMQPRGFEVVSKTNPLLDCNQLPAVDLSLWRDVNGQHQQRQFAEYDYNFKR